MPRTIHLVANSHIDPVWLWDKYEGIDEVINTFRLRLTLVRSNLYAYAADRVIDTLGPLHHTDQGEHQFRLRLCPAAGLSPEHLAGLFTEFNEPFRVLRQNA